MFVAHLSCGSGGGAGIAAFKIHHAVRRAGVTSLFFSLDAREDQIKAGVLPFPRPSYEPNSWAGLKYRAALKLYTRHRPAGSGMFSYHSMPFATPLPAKQKRPDIIHLHWIATGFDYPSLLGSLPKGIPVVWTLHDMEPFTGGCHHNFGCQKFQTACRSCPQLNAFRNPWDLSAIDFKQKTAAYRKLNLHVATVGSELGRDAAKSALFRSVKSMQTIPNGIAVETFTPRDPAECRKALGIPADKYVLGFGAADLSSIYKGLPVLLEALKRTRHQKDFFLLLFGGSPPPNLGLAPGSWLHAGYSSEPDTLARWYSACDLFVFPSLAESLGQVGLEALSCETPVLGSRVGGIPDYLADGVTGRLTQPGDAAELAEKLDWFFEHQAEGKQFGIAGRNVVKERFSLETMQARYLELYHRITQNATPAAG